MPWALSAATDDLPKRGPFQRGPTAYSEDQGDKNQPHVSRYQGPLSLSVVREGDVRAAGAARAGLAGAHDAVPVGEPAALAGEAVAVAAWAAAACAKRSAAQAARIASTSLRPPTSVTRTRNRP
eukprot:TRINITY_DN9816_c0_g1_i8.p2 TRINITY_DN9816_c0_g1~~TRINITY_DN9816_c0_g1_i8.p2  ORF type:complete len:124 (+),score=10.58 TRINITY_DN9816_c0_g1_i8:587-958(+)